MCWVCGTLVSVHVKKMIHMCWNSGTKRLTSSRGKQLWSSATMTQTIMSRIWYLTSPLPSSEIWSVTRFPIHYHHRSVGILGVKQWTYDPCRRIGITLSTSRETLSLMFTHITTCKYNTRGQRALRDSQENRLTWQMCSFVFVNGYPTCLVMCVV